MPKKIESEISHMKTERLTGKEKGIMISYFNNDCALTQKKDTPFKMNIKLQCDYYQTNSLRLMN